MIYFTHQELAATYHVSVKTVRNWIEAAKQGKLDLVLHEANGRSYVSNTAGNIALIEQLAEKGKKYRPHRAIKVVSPRPEFYKLYTQAQIYDILTNLDVYREIPRQYSYFDGGAAYWDDYTQRLSMEVAPNLLTGTLKLLSYNQGYIDQLLSAYKRVNVIDIGVGNAIPVKGLLSHLLEAGKLGRYAGIDISPEMLQIAGGNIRKWFGDRIAFEPYTLDISYERFTSIIAPDSLKSDSQDTVNLILFLGGTWTNFREPDAALRAVHDSMGRNDVLLQSLKLDTATSRRYFDFNADPGKAEIPPIRRFIIDLLNIDDSYYDVEVGYDSERGERYTRIRLKVAVTIKFDFDGQERQLDLNKDEAILLWRVWHYSDLDMLQQLDRCNFHTLHASQTEDWEYMLTVSQIKRS